MNHPIRHSSLLLAAVAIFASLGASSPALLAQGRELPFRAKRDGTVNYEDLMKMTRQAPARDSITDDALAAIKDKHLLKYDDFFVPTGKEEAPPRVDLYESSIILSDGVNHTILPLRSLIFVPEKLQRRVVEAPVGKLILWPDFRKLNASWLRVQEVSLPVAKGDAPLADAVRKQLESGFQMVVSAYKNSPISVMPLKNPPAELSDSSNPASQATRR